MTDRENVIKALEEAIQHYERYSGDEYGREYDFARVEVETLEDAIVLLKEDERAIKHQSDHLDALLKAQEPRVMKVGEVCNWVNSDRVTREPVFIEMRSGVCAWIIDDEVREIPGAENLTSGLYSKTWRCWTSRPDEKRRAETPWG